LRKYLDSVRPHFEEGGRLRGWMNLASGECRPADFSPHGQNLRQLSFGGVHIIDPAVFPLLEAYASGAGRVFSIIPFYLGLAGREDIVAYTPSEPFGWFDIGTPAKLAAAERSLKTF
ncbi:MAG: hypothetical protein K2G30_11460, partial [Muribaculaceae bacterium]|nr:hypothetical protein [Muribaculaceae bacterium]